MKNIYKHQPNISKFKTAMSVILRVTHRFHRIDIQTNVCAYKGLNLYW